MIDTSRPMYRPTKATVKNTYGSPRPSRQGNYNELWINTVKS